MTLPFRQAAVSTRICRPTLAIPRLFRVQSLGEVAFAACFVASMDRIVVLVEPLATAVAVPEGRNPRAPVPSCQRDTPTVILRQHLVDVLCFQFSHFVPSGVKSWSACSGSHPIPYPHLPYLYIWQWGKGRLLPCYHSVGGGWLNSKVR